MTSPSRLEREIALLTWHLKMARMTPIEIAIYHNGLRKKPRQGIEERMEDLAAELSKWLNARRM